MKTLFQWIIAAIGIAAVGNLPAQDHSHLNIGAVGTNQGDALIFDNGDLFATNTGFIMTLNLTNAGTYSGYYAGNITVTALAATTNFAGPVPNAPALGSQIYAQIVSVDGPPGAAFSFWDAGATNPTITLPSGGTGTNAWVVSNNGGVPGSDPFGHIHGRRFTATKPGIYTVGFRAFDGSTNGLNGDPIHSPSSVLKFYFQAGINIAGITRSGNTAAVTFGTAGNRTFYLETTTNTANSNSWTPVLSTPGNDTLQTLMDTNAMENFRFYRVRITTP